MTQRFVLVRTFIIRGGKRVVKTTHCPWCTETAACSACAEAADRAERAGEALGDLEPITDPPGGIR